MNTKKVIIVGGGFGGIKCALDLSSKHLSNTKIILISDKSHFEYHAALYRVVAGSSPLEVCIPLNDIFKGKNVEVITDKVLSIDLEKNTMCGQSDCTYSYDYLVLALGSETAYFDIPGLQENSFGMKSINEALRLNKHLHNVFSECALNIETGDTECATHIVVVGGGATGTELAAELAIYTRELAQKHGLDPRLVTIDLIELSSHLVSLLPEDASLKIEERMRSLGVNIFLNRGVVKEEVEKVYLKDIEMRSKTVIWTAGTRANRLYKDVGLEVNKKGQVSVTNHLQAVGHNNVFVIGDGAATNYSGMAQTALFDGEYVADVIYALFQQKEPKEYSAPPPFYSIPVGRDWAAYVNGSKRYYGKVGWWLRRWVDFHVFSTILPFEKAVVAFQDGRTISETCDICSKN
ncbi:MAG: NAD(P)/FAD-dependent oxidoreductase [Patescibacteria group bacterium]